MAKIKEGSVAHVEQYPSIGKNRLGQIRCGYVFGWSCGMQQKTVTGMSTP